MFFQDTISNGRGDVNYCGTRSYTLSPIKSFLTISDPTMTLSTNLVADIGSYSMTLSFSLTNYPAITYTKTFTATVTCAVTTLAYSAPLIAASTTIQVGIDVQPYLIPFATTRTPDCPNTVTFSFTTNTLPT